MNDTATQTEYTTITEWCNFEDATYGYNNLGDEVVEIEALQNRQDCLRWGERYTHGRAWRVTHEDGTLTRGRSRNLPTAKKDALAALRAGNGTIG